MFFISKILLSEGLLNRMKDKNFVRVCSALKLFRISAVPAIFGKCDIFSKLCVIF